MNTISDTKRDREVLDKLAAGKNNAKNRLKAFNLAANIEYLNNTKKSFDDLGSYLSYEQNSWGDDLSGEELSSIHQAIECGENSADCVMEREANQDNTYIGGK